MRIIKSLYLLLLGFILGNLLFRYVGIVEIIILMLMFFLGFVIGLTFEEF